MDQKELRELEATCIQEEPPACRAGCPVGVDARAFALAMARGDLDGARQILEKSMPFAALTARLCEAPCEQFCLREGLGGAVALGDLETLCIRETSPRGKTLRLPARPKKVAVIGSGPSSLTVAFDLAKKGYPVVVHHLAPAPGAWLRDLPEPVLPRAILDNELTRLATLGVKFSPVEALDAALADAQDADAVYVGQDDTVTKDLSDRLGASDLETLAVSRSGWFSGGMGLTGHPYRFITAVSHGREAAVSMDRFLQNASLTSSRVPLRNGRTALFTQTRDVEAVPRVVPAGPDGYTREEGRQEAVRCLECQCLECVKRCVYLQEHGGYPKTHARRVFNNSAIVQGSRQANKFINSCSLCGQCETICPNDFSMAAMCLDARRQMVREKRMPPSAHWFALEEMRSAGSEQAALIRHASGQDESALLFFPGCQLGGIRPEQTLALYDHLLETEPRTGIWLGCCGAPAHWSGRADELAVLTSTHDGLWRSMGEPVVVTACSSCLAMFREHLPHFRAISAWTLIGSVSGTATGKPLALSDPCTSRHDAETQAAVRNLLRAMHQPLVDLPMSGELTECCGFGGLMDNADSAMARKVAQARVGQSGADFVTYCAMCRDQLARTGKPVLHILDLLLPGSARPASESPAGISERRMNRRKLKNTVLKRYDQDAVTRLPWEDVHLDIPAEVAAMLEERRILEDDLRQVLHASRGSGHFLAHPDGRRIASAELGEVTFWVEYREEGGVARVITAWSHRMRISGGRS